MVYYIGYFLETYSVSVAADSAALQRDNNVPIMTRVLDVSARESVGDRQCIIFTNGSSQKVRRRENIPTYSLALGNIGIMIFLLENYEVHAG